MNILFVSCSFPTPQEPTKGVFNEQLARQLAREHVVDVVAPVPWIVACRRGRLAGRSREGVRATSTPGLHVHHPIFYYPPRLLHARHGTFFWHSIRGTIRRIRAARPPDAVIGYWVHPDGGAAVRVAREAGVPGGVIVGGSDVLVVTRRPARLRQVQRVLRSADFTAAVCGHLCERIVSLGVPAEKVHLWSQGIDSGVFRPGDRSEARRRLGLEPGGRVLLWVGRMVPVKGLDVLLDACDCLARRGEAFRLLLVGDGPLRTALQSRAEALGLSERVRFVGPVPHAELGDWYRAADLTVLPSRSEGLPNVLRESLACGTPFVASRVGGIPEIAGDGGGLLVEAGDPEALAEALAASSAPGRPPGSPSGGWAEAAESLLDLVRGTAPYRDVRPSAHLESPAFTPTSGSAHREAGPPVLFP